MSDPLSLRVDQIAETTGISEPVIWRAIRSGDLVPRYPTTRPVVPVEEVRAWLNSLPTESPRRRTA